MKRQALTISLKELTDLKLQLIKEWNEVPGELPLDYDKKFLVGIINKTGMSDDWEIEQ